jgi:hypothetical protein
MKRFAVTATLSIAAAAASQQQAGNLNVNIVDWTYGLDSPQVLVELSTKNPATVAFLVKLTYQTPEGSSVTQFQIVTRTRFTNVVFPRPADSTLSGLSVTELLPS